MTTTDTTATMSLGRMLAVGALATAVASAATAAVAAAGRAAGISLDVGGVPIPISGFALLTAVFSAVGLVLAAVLFRTVRHPRRVFVWTTVVLTVLSLVPDVVADAAVSTRALLMLTHLVAAAIVVPAVARRLPA
ncbi:DUF6069 family protein [Catellatospora sp. KI3]|uniref:DUF6069 family protein n=1 Tax=Catellatospora sp. KI3 TaxID=3041620 RepID=UPI002482FB65|nr:DUF6069 family protein [Catellatospora sp. KI3]MDI1464772.1 DUF6069 family protein [Catellatospora sp. KI3]